jgi:hypothetical protein
MSRRIDVELTSNKGDGTWTWRSAGAKEPKGTVEAVMLPAAAKVGDVLKIEAEFTLDGVSVLAVIPNKAKEERKGLLELIPVEREFKAVTQQLAKKGGQDRDRRPRKRKDGEAPRSDRPRTPRPQFTPPPDTPMRPKAKRLRAGDIHKKAALAGLSEAERTIAETLLKGGGIAAVREAATEQNRAAKAAGADAVPVDGLVAIAEKLRPTLHVADWLDRAEAAKKDLEQLDLRDLRSVVVAAADPIVARDENTKALATELKAALTRRQDEEYQLWLGDIDAAISVGRVIRALKTSAQPPKAGVPFPSELATKLIAATNATLTSDALPERWVAVLEALAFSPICKQVNPAQAPTAVSDELRATVLRLGPALPDFAALLGVEIPANAPQPKPLRTVPANRKKPAKEISSKKD